jgi:hypothetical protein
MLSICRTSPSFSREVVDNAHRSEVHSSAGGRSVGDGDGGRHVCPAASHAPGNAEWSYRPGLRRCLEPRWKDHRDGRVRQHGPALGGDHPEGDQEPRGAFQAGPGRGLLSRRPTARLGKPGQLRQNLGHPRRRTGQDPDGTGVGSGGPRRQARWKRGRRGRGKVRADLGSGQERVHQGTGWLRQRGRERGLAAGRGTDRRRRQVPHHPAMEGGLHARRPD